MSPRAICPRCNAPGILVRNFRIHDTSGKLSDEPTTHLCTKCGFLWQHNSRLVGGNALFAKTERIRSAFLDLQQVLEAELGDIVMGERESLGQACRLARDLAFAEAKRQEAVAEACMALNELHCTRSLDSSDAKLEPTPAPDAAAVLSDTLARVVAKHANAELIEALNAAIKRIVDTK